MNPLIHFLIMFLVVCLVLAIVWWVLGLLPLPPPFRNIAIAILAIVVLIYVLASIGGTGHTGLLGYLPARPQHEDTARATVGREDRLPGRHRHFLLV